MKKHLTVLLLVGLLGACADTKEPVAPPLYYGYDAGQKINLNVQHIAIMDHTVQLPDSPYVGHQFHPTLDEALHQWAKDRLRAVGSVGQITFVIKDASLTTDSLLVNRNPDKVLKRQQASEYKARAEVEIMLDGKTGYGRATAEATRSATLPENPLESERKAIYVGVLNGLMQDLNRSLESSIQEHLGDFVQGAPVIEDSRGPAMAPHMETGKPSNLMIENGAMPSPDRSPPPAPVMDDGSMPNIMQ